MSAVQAEAVVRSLRLILLSSLAVWASVRLAAADCENGALDRSGGGCIAPPSTEARRPAALVNRGDTASGQGRLAAALKQPELALADFDAALTLDPGAAAVRAGEMRARLAVADGS